MAHQFVREPLRAEEADRLANACRSPEEKLIVWTLLDTGLRVSGTLLLDPGQRPVAATLPPRYGQGEPRGTQSKQRVVPLSADRRDPRALLRPERQLVRRHAQAQKIVAAPRGQPLFLVFCCGPPANLLYS